MGRTLRGLGFGLLVLVLLVLPTTGAEPAGLQESWDAVYLGAGRSARSIRGSSR